MSFALAVREAPAPLPSTADLQLLFARLNLEHFKGALRAHRIEYNPRLSTVSGRITYRPALIELSSLLLERNPDHVEDTLLHEMVHAWLHQSGLPSGHGPEFKTKMREVGLRSIYHDLPVARRRSRRRYVLECPRCRISIMRKCRPGGRVSCARCSPHGFDRRVEMHVREIVR
ncbi:MAG: SprT-like domain-containing protein [Candidatus Eremiobacteraeota bacterium]|nr:SprT-like domain-containing protein [Candidatus Eremiobacteraeota bacterium]MBV8222279.1 SprT-like domain-containing protein [Candidatus Eremiobacteraeota bacterium]